MRLKTIIILICSASKENNIENQSQTTEGKEADKENAKIGIIPGDSLRPMFRGQDDDAF